MHVAILIGRFPPGVIGGAELQAQGWARRLAGRHRVTVITRLDAPGQFGREEREGYTVMRLPVSPVPGLRAANDLAGIQRVIGSLSPKPDVLLCFMTFISGLAGVRVGRHFGIPAVTWVRGEAEYRLATRPLERLVSPSVWRDSRGVLVQSGWNRAELLRELRRASPADAEDVARKLEIVPNGLDLPAGPFVPGERVLSVCRLIPDKGVADLVAACAAARLPLTVAGDGPERHALEAQARGLGADVRFEGFVDRAGLDRLFRAASAFVLPSHRGEGLPNAVLEAMSHARPVVVTPSGATRDLVSEGRNGLIVPAGDRAALIGALRRIHAEPAFAASLGVGARETAGQFAWESVHERLETVLARWSSPRPTRVCFYSPHLRPALGGEGAGATGGGEVQMALVARGLARRGLEVDVVTCEDDQPEAETVEGVRVLRAWRPSAGWPVLRFFHPRLTSTLAALRRSGADVFVVKGAGLNAGLTRDVARALDRRFVFVAGHDLDVSAGLPRVTGPRDRWWAKRGLLGADAVVVQTEHQRALLNAGFGLDAHVITNAVVSPQRAIDPGVNTAVLWVGTYKGAKRPEWFVRFAERHPEIPCVMAGMIPPPPLDDREYRRVRAAAATLSNLEVEGAVPHARMAALYARGALLAHTSAAEGFPNVLLEAWSHGLPVVAAFDPDGVIARERLGECHATFEAWEEAVLRLWSDPAARREAGARARAHVEQTHGLDRALDRYTALVDTLAGPRCVPPAERPEAMRRALPRPAAPRARGRQEAPAEPGRAARVAFLQASLAVGGAERMVQGLIRSMNPLLVSSLVVTLYEPGDVGEELLAEDRPVVSRLARSRFDNQVGRRLRAVYEEHGIDVVYVIDSPLPKFWSGLLRRQSDRPRVVVGFHSSGALGHPMQHLLSRLATVPVADRHIALSETHRRFLSEQYGVRPERIEVIPSGIDLTRFDAASPREAARARAGLPAGVPLVGIVAALRPEKDHALFLRAAKRVAGQVPAARFVLVGDGPERAAVEGLRDALGLGASVSLLGTRPDVPDLFRAMDVAVLCSSSETLPLTLMEASASGTAVVATDVGSVRDLVLDGRNGFLVPAGDEIRLAERICELLTREDERARMGTEGRALAESRFDERVMVRHYERLFRDAAGLAS